MGINPSGDGERERARHAEEPKDLTAESGERWPFDVGARPFGTRGSDFWMTGAEDLFLDLEERRRRVKGVGRGLRERLRDLKRTAESASLSSSFMAVEDVTRRAAERVTGAK